MTKPKSTKAKDAALKAAEKVLHAPGSSKAAKTAKGSALSAKAGKKPTSKEQLADKNAELKVLLDETNNLIILRRELVYKCSQKDMEIANLKQELLKAQQEVLLHQKNLRAEKIFGDMQFSLVKSLERKLNTPWYTKFINFLKGD